MMPETDGLKIAGFVPLSLCDYPGVVASVVFTQGCQFRCPWCHNGALLDPLAIPQGGLLPEREIFARLRERKGKIQGVVVTGGEPTIQLPLPTFLAALRAEGFQIKLDTNGGCPDMIERCIQEKLVDFFAMDIKAPWGKYPLVAGIAESLVAKIRKSVRLISQSGLPHQFRTTRVTPLLTAEDEAEISRQIPAGSPHVWQTFRPQFSVDPTLRG